MVKKIAIILIFIAGLASIGAGYKYIIATQFASYHAELVGKSWSEIEPAIQSMIVGMMTVLGGGFIASVWHYSFSMLLIH